MRLRKLVMGGWDVGSESWEGGAQEVYHERS